MVAQSTPQTWNFSGLAPPGALSTPVPVSANELEAEEPTTSVARASPAWVGEKSTENVVEAPAATVAGIGAEESLENASDNTTVLCKDTLTADCDVFVTVKVTDTVLPSETYPKSKVVESGVRVLPSHC